jgi:protease IV
VMRVDQGMTPALRDYVQLTIEHGYEKFLSHVVAGRDSTREAVDAVARGRVWTGQDALRLKLVDELGGMEQAVKVAAKLANLGEDYSVERIDPELSFAESLAMQLQIRVARTTGKLAGASLARVDRVLAPLHSVTREVEKLQPLLEQRAALAYCFCRVH